MSYPIAYVSLAQLVELPGSLELTQLASDKHGNLVEPELLELTLLDGDRSAWSAEEIAAANRARSRIETAVAEAGALIDGYLGKRYALPLSSPPGILATWARAIARYKLHGDRISGEDKDPIARDYRDALRFLAQIAEGKFSLGLEDPVAQGPSLGEVRIESGAKVFGREYLP